MTGICGIRSLRATRWFFLENCNLHNPNMHAMPEMTNSSVAGIVMTRVIRRVMWKLNCSGCRSVGLRVNEAGIFHAERALGRGLDAPTKHNYCQKCNCTEKQNVKPPIKHLVYLRQIEWATWMLKIAKYLYLKGNGVQLLLWNWSRFLPVAQTNTKTILWRMAWGSRSRWSHKYLWKEPHCDVGWLSRRRRFTAKSGVPNRKIGQDAAIKASIGFDW